MTRRVANGIQIVFTFADFVFLEIRFKFGWELDFQTKLKDMADYAATRSCSALLTPVEKLGKKKKKSSASRTLYCKGVTVTDKNKKS